MTTLKRSGITEEKKAALDALALKVLNASGNVEQYQAIVTSLTEKAENFQGFLAAADAVRASTLVNKNLVHQLTQSAIDLQSNSDIAWKEMAKADGQTRALATKVNDVISKLIYSAEIINKLSLNVIKAKALNPLISDELVSRIGNAGADANNAISLTLIALQSTFAVQASNLESMEAFTLENEQSSSFSKMLTEGDSSITNLLYKAYSDADDQYDRSLKAYHITSNQLSDAQAKLDKAQVKLKSLQAGLNAANAAAFAS